MDTDTEISRRKVAAIAWVSLYTLNLYVYGKLAIDYKRKIALYTKHGT